MCVYESTSSPHSPALKLLYYRVSQSVPFRAHVISMTNHYLVQGVRKMYHILPSRSILLKVCSCKPTHGFEEVRYTEGPVAYIRGF